MPIPPPLSQNLSRKLSAYPPAYVWIAVGHVRLENLHGLGFT